MTLLLHAQAPIKKFHLVAEHESPIGVSVRDEFEIYGEVIGNRLLSGGALTKRNYKQGKEIELEIEDA